MAHREAVPESGPISAGRARTRVNLGTKLVLLAGFGGVLGLMALAGLDSIQALHEIEAQNAQITREYLSRNRSLEQIRSALYLSSTFVRDYLTEPSAEAAQASLSGLRGLKDEMDLALRAYSSSIPPQKRRLGSDLAKEVTAIGTPWRRCSSGRRRKGASKVTGFYRQRYSRAGPWCWESRTKSPQPTSRH